MIICFATRKQMDFRAKVHVLSHRNHTAVAVYLQWTPRNMEPYGGSVKKKKRRKMSWTYAFTRISGWRVEQRETILFMSLITFPERCIYWSKAHKFSLSELYRRHINVRAALFNSRCLISPSFRIRKWKWETQEEKIKNRGNSLLFYSVWLAGARLSFSFFSLFYPLCDL